MRKNLFVGVSSVVSFIAGSLLAILLLGGPNERGHNEASQPTRAAFQASGECKKHSGNPVGVFVGKAPHIKAISDPAILYDDGTYRLWFSCNDGKVSQEGIDYLQKLRKNTPFGAADFNLEALRSGMGSRREPTIKDVRLIRSNIGKISCEWVLAPGADRDVRLLYLHGGGFVSGSGAFYLALAAHLSAAAECSVLLPDYRLAPEHPFPAGLEDCIAAHQWIVSNGPSGPGRAKATFIAGDSAGGNLTLATLLALRDRRLPLPAGGIPLSPTTDWTLESKSLKTVDDPIISARTMPVFRKLYLGKTDPRSMCGLRAGPVAPRATGNIGPPQHRASRPRDRRRPRFGTCRL